MFSAFQTFGRLGAGGLPFSERALWPLGASSPGLWIDPSYVASCYQDRAGTTALSTIGAVLDSSNPVGLMLDRKSGLVLGPELVTNGDFSGGSTGWTAGAGWSISSSAAASAASGQLTQSGVCSSSKYYKVTLTASVASGYAVIHLGNGASETINVSDSLTFYLHSGSSGSTLTVYSFSLTGSIDNISVREIPGNHLSQSTSAARPVASARKNLLVGTATLSTQSVTVTAIPHTITFSGGGTVTASDAYVGALTNGQTFTPSAGTLTLTVSGSVTSAQLEHGSAATTYQAVVSASDYTASGFPVYTKFDGTDDALSSATFSAGTLTSSMDCLIAVRRDSGAKVIIGLAKDTLGNNYFGLCESGSSTPNYVGAGTPTVWVDGAQLAGGTVVTAGTIHTALSAGDWHILEFRGLNLSTWTSVIFGNCFTGYFVNGALGKIELFASGQDANRDKARARMAAYFGVTLP